MNDSITIKSKGSGSTTEVFHRGKKLTGLVKIEIDPILPKELVTARLTFYGVKLEISNIEETSE